MIVPDINLLIYAHNAAMEQHDPARQWWEDALEQAASGGPQVGLSWVVMLGFGRLTTHPRVFDSAIPPSEALLRGASWLERKGVRVLDPGPGHLATLSRLFNATGVAANLTTDTHLAALALEYNAELHSNDADFARFPGLSWVNPLS